jgi:RimJ/RimL family protein N-acetyltransferase
VQPQSPAPGKTVLETPRLLLRELTLADAGFFLRLVNEPSWLRFIGDRGVRDLEGSRRYLADGPLASYARNGYGLWVVHPRQRSEPVGLCGLVRRDSLPGPDLGFAFFPSAWGRGWAAESAAAVLDHARYGLAIRRVLAITDPANAASIRVLRRVGMRKAGNHRLPGEKLTLHLYARNL